MNAFKKYISLVSLTVLLSSCGGGGGTSSSSSTYQDAYVLDERISSYVSSTYSTGNYGVFYHEGISYGFYRANGNKKGAFADFLPFSHPFGETLGGSIFNLDDLRDLDSITISYRTGKDHGNDKPTLYYGASDYSSFIDLEYAREGNVFSFAFPSNTHYFKLESGDSLLKVISMSCNKSKEKRPAQKRTPKNANEGQFRASPKPYEGSLMDGQSKQSVPVKVKVVDGRYEVLESKEYTYYSFDYVAAHPEVKKDAAMIDPMDVANYYALFRTFPANYAINEDEIMNPVKMIFRDDARVVSTYSRTDGYVRFVPTKMNNGRPLYHEFDIALNEEYSNHSRGVGRVVAFETGFEKDSYGNGSQVVSVFTDDHYSTFQEFNNLGSFMPRFGAELRAVNTIWSEPTLVEPR